MEGFTMTNQEQYQEALGRAAGGLSLGNYPAIFAGFTQIGIPQSEIKPREMDCLGRVRYLAPGQSEPDPRE
jgi:hypothetical protein